jgi:hypothetical protein
VSGEWGAVMRIGSGIRIIYYIKKKIPVPGPVPVSGECETVRRIGSGIRMLFTAG